MGIRVELGASKDVDSFLYGAWLGLSCKTCLFNSSCHFV